MKCKKDLIVVCGPTASGKTSLGVQIALRLNGEIISADSRQVYRGMDIGTGKDLKEYVTSEGKVPFHLIDVSDPAQIYTLFHYKNDFFKAFDQIVSRKKMPVVVGGTGLYIEAVLKDYAIPAIPENAQLRADLSKQQKSDLEKKLFELDRHLYQKTDLSSKKRVIRAIEVAMSDQCREIEPYQSRKIDPLVLCTRWQRTKLRERIDARLETRFKEGMIEEVRKLLHSEIPRERFALFGMEYKHVARFIDNEINYESMVEQLRQSIHQLAKRQETWFRGMEKRGIEVNWVEDANLEIAMGVVESVLGKGQSNH
ncbi:MAG TPA: tRNA (adenosine(37)-N6)-dimethylallyltransferase MiaA [Chitinispirillaceae bacterium]|nr:tRNA (adenosine(37)-N6)-dimethylallyltransferase MiaA [Chitinispirillaceae bacterium]